MSSNIVYSHPDDCPLVVPLFPLVEALLLPRGQIPLNVFEPRYMMMIDDALKGSRLIGLIQPDFQTTGSPLLPALFSVGCVGRITQYAETGDGRYLVTLTGISRFHITHEVLTTTLYRQAQVDYSRYASDFMPRAGEDDVDRDAIIQSLRRFAERHELDIDWTSVKSVPLEALVNALAMMCPYGVREKQALLEAMTLKERADLLIALTEIEEAKGSSGHGDHGLQ
jgi:Lon protease-like protein